MKKVCRFCGRTIVWKKGFGWVAPEGGGPLGTTHCSGGKRHYPR